MKKFNTKDLNEKFKVNIDHLIDKIYEQTDEIDLREIIAEQNRGNIDASIFVQTTFLNKKNNPTYFKSFVAEKKAMNHLKTLSSLQIKIENELSDSVFKEQTIVDIESWIKEYENRNAN